MPHLVPDVSIAILTIIVSCIGLALMNESAQSLSNLDFKGDKELHRVKRDVQVQGEKASPASNAQSRSSSNANEVEHNSQKVNCSLSANHNDTRCKDDVPVGTLLRLSQNKAMLLRTLYVSLGVTGIVVCYFVVRAVRLRRRRSKSRKYGIITQHDQGDVEMEPLGDGFLGPPSGKDAGGEARTRGREVPADLRADLSAEVNRQRFSMNIARPLTLPQIMRRANVPSLPRGSQIEHRHCAEISSSNT
ncbi:membrane protein fam174-like [Plakobranchus ocellatus]|uniref:Membrane protein fam174-like n=1 Tax=Plakobranchus ocellatus TaxID=259542 RepID=A0AAV4AWY1_9GAST|nr:membrane protein fam174-like [Plakobranchus ocellatus]